MVLSCLVTVVGSASADVSLLDLAVLLVKEVVYMESGADNDGRGNGAVVYNCPNCPPPKRNTSALPARKAG